MLKKTPEELQALRDEFKSWIDNIPDTQLERVAGMLKMVGALKK